MATKAVDIVTIARGIDAFNEKRGFNPENWVASKATQRAFLELYMTIAGSTNLVKGSKVTMKTSGRTVNIDSKLDVDVKWVKKGIKGNIGGYSSFELDSNFTTVGKQPLVKIKTRQGYYLCLIMPGKSFKDELSLAEYAFSVNDKFGSAKGGTSYTAIKVPHVRFDVKPKTSFAIGLVTYPSPWEISRCTQTISYKMDEVGAKSRIQTRMRFTFKGVPKPSKVLVFDKPFVGWFVDRSNMPISIFYADKDSWVSEGSEK